MIVFVHFFDLHHITTRRDIPTHNILYFYGVFNIKKKNIFTNNNSIPILVFGFEYNVFVVSAQLFCSEWILNNFQTRILIQI